MVLVIVSLMRWWKLLFVVMDRKTNVSGRTEEDVVVCVDLKRPER